MGSRSDRRPYANLYALSLRAIIPAFALPLKAVAESVTVSLEPLLQPVINRAGFAVTRDYQQAPRPPLTNENWQWAQQQIQQLNHQA